MAGKNSITFLEAPQASPARLRGRTSRKMKMKLCEEADIRISAAEFSFLFPVNSEAQKLEIKFHRLSL